MSVLSDFVLPTNPDDMEKIRNSLEEISNQTHMMNDRKEAIKDIAKTLKDEYDMSTSLINKLVKAMDDGAYEEMSMENSVFELVRETFFGNPMAPENNPDNNNVAV